MGVAYFLLLCSLGLAVTAQECSRPVPGPNMRLSDSDSALTAFPDGTKVTFTCNLGYQVEGGSRSSTCTAGTWSPVSLLCGLKSCPSLGDLTNGQVHYDDNGPMFGTAATFTCNTGYNLVGSNSISCGDKGWLGRPPVCEVLTCDQPPAVIDGSFSPVKDTYDYLEVIRYSCIKDYTVNGAETTSCSENGSFTPQPPTCVKVECRELNVPNGVWSSGSRPPYGYKATVTYKCETGYKMEGSPTATCGINSQWSQLPTCKPQNCSRPVGGADMSLKDPPQSFPHGTVVTFACDFGFEPAGGSADSTCTLGSWSPVTLKCQTKMCSRPDAGPHMSLKDPPQTFPHGTTVTFACDDGYKRAEGSADITCTAGTWNAVTLKCQIVSCNTPEVENAEKVGQSSPPYTYKQTVTFKCNEDFVMDGKDTVTCEKEGQWKPALPTCSDGNILVTPTWKIILIVIGIAFCIIIGGVVCYKYGPCKKRNRGSTRGYPINDATNHGEEVALS